MADFDDIDALLSSSLKSAAEPANSAGVADAIRSRVAAGDAGTSVAGSTAPGWKAPAPKWFWPLLGTVLGLGGVVVILVIVAVGLRPLDPIATQNTVPTSSPSPTPTLTPTPTPTRTPSPTPTPTVEEEPPPPPPPPRDQTAPTIKPGQWSPGVVWGQKTPCGGTTSDIVVTTADNVGVTSVTTATSLAGTTVALVSSSPNGSVYRFTATQIQNQTDTLVTVTFTAYDAAGNATSAATQIMNAWNCVT